MRAWTCHGRTQKEMVEKLASVSVSWRQQLINAYLYTCSRWKSGTGNSIPHMSTPYVTFTHCACTVIQSTMQAGIIKYKPTQEAMTKVDRANYAGGRSGAYVDAPQPIGYGQTISAPHMHAHALEELMPTLQKAAQDHPDTELKILDVGCGSGYLTACFGRLVDRGPNGPILPVKGRVYGIDAWSELVDFSRANMMKEDSELFDSGTVSLQFGDGWEGLPDAGPFNAIHVGAAAATFPKSLMQQLAVDGVMVIPVGPDGGVQNLYNVRKIKGSPKFDENDYVIKNLLGVHVRFVPLFHP